MIFLSQKYYTHNSVILIYHFTKRHEMSQTKNDRKYIFWKRSEM
ncbi:hypothetical protein HMPREF1705_04746 [Acetomicrobium hydrogeniformans ATCC BAA-1850]|uniref:Uncharacterized protein n=1 Tax=Acetomicrobium hydrogeniformans ATCC BAA-1850 TaxID=592015 RepID=A0A0T5X962_9BACT|nr:hypothetical protein HMPREF1705_04746 [Acetomicrobium hydrogeniformans ATCC BAA-1850]